MAEDYRKRRYAGCAGCSIVLSLFVISISLVIGWFIRQGPPGDHGVLPYFLIYIPLAMIAFAVAMILLSILLRRAYNPNVPINFTAPTRLCRIQLPPALLQGSVLRTTRVCREDKVKWDGIDLHLREMCHE